MLHAETSMGLACKWSPPETWAHLAGSMNSLHVLQANSWPSHATSSAYPAAS